MRLQEISRKMLAKRRRICVDTQTDSGSTLRVKDKGINVREPKVLRKDASILTDRHENYELLEASNIVVRRVKEIATSTTDAPEQLPIYFRDAGNITDHCSSHWDSMELCQHDSGILYDDDHLDGPVAMMESSVNTNSPVEPQCAGAQTGMDNARSCCDDKLHRKSGYGQHKPSKPCCPSAKASGGSAQSVDPHIQRMLGHNEHEPHQDDTVHHHDLYEDHRNDDRHNHNDHTQQDNNHDARHDHGDDRHDQDDGHHNHGDDRHSHGDDRHSHDDDRHSHDDDHHNHDDGHGHDDDHHHDDDRHNHNGDHDNHHDHHDHHDNHHDHHDSHHDHHDNHHDHHDNHHDHHDNHHDHHDNHHAHHDHRDDYSHDHYQHHQDPHDCQDHDHHHEDHYTVVRPCCHPDPRLSHTQCPDNCDKSVISINLPDMINITIQSPSLFESKIRLHDSKEPHRCAAKRDSYTQIYKSDGLDVGTLTDEYSFRYGFRDVPMTVPRASNFHTDGRRFRIENIFQNSYRPAEPAADLHQRNNSLLSDSIGTCFAVRSRDKVYASDRSPIPQNKSRIGDCSTKPNQRSTDTWPTTSGWRSQSYMDISKRQYTTSSTPSIGKSTLGSAYFNHHDLTPLSHPSDYWCNNYNIYTCNNVDERSRTIASVETPADKFPKHSCHSTSSTSKDLSASSLIGIIDCWGICKQGSNPSDDTLNPTSEKVRRAGDLNASSLYPPDLVSPTKYGDGCLEVLDSDETVDRKRTKINLSSVDLTVPVPFKSMVLDIPCVAIVLKDKRTADNGGFFFKSREETHVSFGEAGMIIKPISSRLDYKGARSSESPLNDCELTQMKISCNYSPEPSQSERVDPDRHLLGASERSMKVIQNDVDDVLVFLQNMHLSNKYCSTYDAVSRECHVKQRRGTSKDLNLKSKVGKENLKISGCNTYEKHLRDIQRLEECFSRVKYDDNVREGELHAGGDESAEAKPNLAEFSHDDRKPINLLGDVSIGYDNNCEADRYFYRYSDDIDAQMASANFDSRTLARYRRLIGRSSSGGRGTQAKTNCSLLQSRVGDDLCAPKIYPKSSGTVDSDVLITMVRKSRTAKCTMPTDQVSNDNQSSGEAFSVFEEPIDRISEVNGKFQYSASPRNKFLQLLSERRRIVEKSRYTGTA